MTLAPSRPQSSFARFRRLRRTPGLRRLVQETRLDPGSFVLPLFVDARISEPTPIASLPGHFRWPPNRVGEIAMRADAAGIGALLLFGLPDEKDDGRAAADPLGPVPSAIRTIRAAVPEAVLIADVCLCEYTTHGHCGVLRQKAERGSGFAGPSESISLELARAEGHVLEQDGSVDNDATLPFLAAAATAYAAAGADIVAPSDMMDGRVAAVRAALDGAGHEDIAVMAYAAKFASAFYGPFRDAADCAPQFGDRSGYQMDPPNAREALAEIAADLAEGADVVMVKPAGPYLDVIAAARARFDAPLAAYQVSGEYAALHAAAERGWLELQPAALESLTAIARAGADVLITYFALEASAWLRER